MWYIICILFFISRNNISGQNTFFDSRNEGVLAAFGDYNSDELTDAFVITNRSNLQIYFAYDKEPFLRPSHYQCNFTDFNITSVVPGDFDGDAFMDVLFTTVSNEEDTSDIQQSRILWGGGPLFNCSNATIVKASTLGQPLALDYNHDMVIDLFGINLKGERVFWIFNHSRTLPTQIPLGDGPNKEVKHPHCHSVLAYNDDSAADLLISTKFDIEIWLGSENPGFTYADSIELPIGAEIIFGQVLFLDVALSGHFFPMLPVCFNPDCFNSTILIYDNDNWRDLKINFNDGRGTTWRLIPPRKDTYLDTMTMRSGDYNMDGYPDILLTLSPENNNDTQVFLLHNKPCDFEECQFHRTYEILWDKTESFGKNVVLAAFYDFYMDGVLDIIYIKKNSSSGTYNMNAYKNELQYDTNFVKVIVVTGLTNAKAPGTYGVLNRRKGTYGTNLPGPKIGYSTVSQEGNYRVGVCAQLSQSAYYALQLPYTIFGLDRTPNFVDQLTVGLGGLTKTWMQIIPNSQIVVIPSPPDDPTQWRVQLFVTPSKLVLNSVLVLTAILVIILVSVAVLHWKERNDREDDLTEIDSKSYVKL